MDAVTYSNAAVQAELEYWNFVKVDIDEHKRAKAYFGISGIPQAIMMSPQGDKAPPMPGKIEPAPFIQALKLYREGL